MYQFIAPAAVVMIKILVRHSVSNAIADGISEARYEVDKRTTRSLVSSLVNIVVNVSSLLLAVYVSPYFFDISVIVYLVSSIYLGSILYGCYSILINAPSIFKYIFIHKLNLEDYVHDEIYNESRSAAQSEINNKNFIVRGLNSLFGKNSSEIASDIAYFATRLVFRKLIIFSFIIGLVTGAYVLIFRIIVAPVLIEESTGLGIFQAALYPIAVSIDYFFNTNIIVWIV